MSDSNERAMDDFVKSFDRELRDLEGAEELYSDEIVVSDWMNPGHDLTGTGEQVTEFIAPILDSFPDVHFEVTDTMRSGDRLLVCGFFTGTMKKDYWGFPAHGRRVRWEARDLYRFKDGKIDRIWYANDTLTVARELGAAIDDKRLW